MAQILVSETRASLMWFQWVQLHRQILPPLILRKADLAPLTFKKGPFIFSLLEQIKKICTHNYEIQRKTQQNVVYAYKIT